MKNQIIKDLPIYLNGFAISYLTFGRQFGIVDILFFIIAGLSFAFYGRSFKK